MNDVKRPYPRTAPCAVSCRGDGDQVLALIGKNLHDGVAGFGDTLPEALRALADELEWEVGVESEGVGRAILTEAIQFTFDPANAGLTCKEMREAIERNFGKGVGRALIAQIPMAGAYREPVTKTPSKLLSIDRKGNVGSGS